MITAAKVVLLIVYPRNTLAINEKQIVNGIPIATQTPDLLFRKRNNISKIKIKPIIPLCEMIFRRLRTSIDSSSSKASLIGTFFRCVSLNLVVICCTALRESRIPLFQYLRDMVDIPLSTIQRFPHSQEKHASGA